MHKWLIIFLGLVVGLGLQKAEAQQQDTLLASFSSMGAFDEAVAFDIAPTGEIYVVDQGSSSLHVLTPEDGVLEWGGPGSGEGQFDMPADIDATNGLVLVVADAANGRIQRFSREFLFLESLDVHVDDFSGVGFDNEPAYRQSDLGASGESLGRPVSVITSRENDMYALDENSRVVVKWDAQRKIEQIIGGFDQGAGRLLEPAFLTLSRDGTLYVADKGHDAIVVYDAFGGFESMMAVGFGAELQTIRAVDYFSPKTGTKQLLLAGFHDQVMVFERGRLEYGIGLSLPDQLVDITLYENTLYVLTRRHLYSIEVPDLFPWKEANSNN